MKQLLPVLLLALTTGCPPPAPGAPCDPGEAHCSDFNEGLFCEEGRLRALECRGPQGCSTYPTGRVICDHTISLSGDPCLATAEGEKQCNRANANELIVCRSGTWMEEACKGCVQEGSTITCQP
jgi:hypothetical protein